MATVSVFIGAGISYCNWYFHGHNGNVTSSGTAYGGDTISKTSSVSSYYISLYPVLKDNYSNAVFHRSDGYNQTIAYDRDIYFTANKSGTLSATYNPPATYTLSYNGNNATGGSTTSQSGSTSYTVKQCGFYKTGYTFKYWQTASGTKYYPGNTISLSGNTTLYAYWERTTYTITYNANGGTGAPSAQTKTYGTDLVLSTTRPTRSGYDFVNWFDGTDYYYPGGTYTANSPATLYAQWQIKTYTVSYNANGGSGAPSAQTKTHGVDLTLSSTVPIRSGYDFVNWFDGTDYYSPGGTYTANSPASLYAQWRLKTYTISYNANGGTGAPSAQTKTHGVDLVLSSTVPTRDGYIFVNWFDGTDYYYPGQTYTANSPASLYAQWIQTFRITYNGNHATGGSTEAQSGSVSYTVRECGFYKSGYYFKYWETSAGTIYRPGDSITPSENLTLYAQWEARSYFYWHGSDTQDSAYFAAGQRVDLAVTASGWNNLCAAINKLREDIGLATIAFASVSDGDEISSVKYNIVSNAIKQIVNAGYGSITPVTVTAGQEILTSHFNGGNSLKAAFNSALAAV